MSQIITPRFAEHIKTTSTEFQRSLEQAMANRRRLGDYYRKKAALCAITGKPMRIKHAHQQLIQAAR